MRKYVIVFFVLGLISLLTASLTLQSAELKTETAEGGQASTGLDGLLIRLQAEIDRLHRPEVSGLMEKLRSAVKSENGSIRIASANAPFGFQSYTNQSGLTTPKGFALPYYGSTGIISPCSFYPLFVEQALNRLVCGNYPAPIPFVTGLSTPTDVISPYYYSSSTTFGSYLYVTESGANRISKIASSGVVTSFATFTSAPKRMALSPSLGAFSPDVLFVSLADGRIVKVESNGTVSPCVSGLSGPEGLVFGPGGAAYKDTLFVAETSAKRISKVSAGCVATVFASTGSESPFGIDISPGGAWGPVDTLYIATGPYLLRMDGNGGLRQFEATSNSDTVHISNYAAPLPLDDRLGLGNFLYFTDFVAGQAASGTLTEAYTGPPSITLSQTGCNPCRTGDTFSLAARVINASSIDLPIEIKAGFVLVDGTPVFYDPSVGNNKHFEIFMPSGFDFQGPWFNFTIPAVPAGIYCYEAELLDSEAVYLNVYNGTRTCFTVLP